MARPARWHFTLVTYIISAFFMFALQAATLDAPTLVFQEYSKQKATSGEREIHEYLSAHMKDASTAKTAKMTKLILKLAKKHNFHPGLILSIIRVESGFQPWAVSPRGALGLMQIMPDTGQWIAQRAGMKWEGPTTLLNEETNASMGVWYLAYLRDKYGGDLKKTLLAYNRGPAKLDEEMAEGKNTTLAYFHKVRQYLPKPLL